jgi:hypothetical protein
MVEKGQSVGSFQDGYLPDAALIFVACAMSDPQRKAELLARSEEFFGRALASPLVPKDYTLTNWARAMYARGDYAAAWSKVAELRRTTGKDMSAQFLAGLSAKMPEPK